MKANQEGSLFSIASFFFSPIISRLWAVNVGSGRSNRRIKGRTKAKVVAHGLVALNMMVDAQARSRISRLRHCGLISLRHTHVGNDVFSRKTRYALRRLAPIGFARLLGAILGVTALAAAPVRAQDVNIDPTTRPPGGVLNIPPGFLVPGPSAISPGSNTITGTLSIGTSAGAGTLNVTALDPRGGNVKAGFINIGSGGAHGTLNIANGGSVTSTETDITMGSTLENTIGSGPLLTTFLDVETGGNVKLLQGGTITGNADGALLLTPVIPLS